MNDPVSRLDTIFPDDIGEALGVMPEAEIEAQILSVAPGTIRALLTEIADRKLWGELYAVASKRSDQWSLDLSSFFPREERFVEPLTNLLGLVTTEHGKVCLAQEAADWPWGARTAQLIPDVVDAVIRIRGELSPEYEKCGPNLDSVSADLTRLAGQLSSGRAVPGDG